MNISEIVGRLVIVRLEIRSYSGKQSLSEEDLGTKLSAQMPPRDLAKLGFKRVLPPEDLRQFAALRQRASRACFAVGPRFLGDAFAIPEDKASALMEELESIRTKMLDRRDALIANYDMRVQAWANAHPEWRERILASAPSAEYVKGRIGFEIFPFRIVADKTADVGESYLAREVTGLSGKIIAEIGMEARVAWKDVFTGGIVTQRTIRPLKGMLEKAKGLAFLDSGISGLVSHMESILMQVPTSGPIQGTALAAVTGLMLLLSNPDMVHLQVYAAHEQPNAVGEDKVVVAAAVPASVDQSPDEDAFVPDLPRVRAPTLIPVKGNVAPAWAF